jgi:hypothetical protein
MDVVRVRNHGTIRMSNPPSPGNACGDDRHHVVIVMLCSTVEMRAALSMRSARRDSTPAW